MAEKIQIAISDSLNIILNDPNSNTPLAAGCCMFFVTGLTYNTTTIEGMFPTEEVDFNAVTNSVSIGGICVGRRNMVLQECEVIQRKLSNTTEIVETFMTSKDFEENVHFV
jgi:hypothetical protein